jgi:hypothetical protein
MIARAMPSKSKRWAVAAILVVAAVLAATSHVYLNLESGGGTVLWNAQEAYFFVGIDRIGHRINGLRFPWFLVKNYLGAIEDPDDRIESSDVVRVTPSGVEHHSFTISDPEKGADMLTPLEDRIYANCPALGGLCVWAGDQFEPATPEERRRLEGINHLTSKAIVNGEGGWSKRGFGVGPGGSSVTLTIQVANPFGLSVSESAAIIGPRTVSIDVQHAGRARERIWSSTLRWWFVDRTEYQRVFGKSK